MNENLSKQVALLHVWNEKTLSEINLDQVNGTILIKKLLLENVPLKEYTKYFTVKDFIKDTSYPASMHKNVYSDMSKFVERSSIVYA
jgi:hypothetical protein